MSKNQSNPGIDQSSFLSHLKELRWRIIKAAAIVLLVFLVLSFWPGYNKMYDLMALPMISTMPNGQSTMIATGVVSPFLVPLKVTLLVSFLIALPFVLYQVWAFIAPGLYQHEKRLVLPLVLISTLLFYVGIAFCYFIVLNTVFHFMASVAPSSVTIAPDIQEYLSFVMTMFVVFGITFEVPIVVIVLVSVGIVSLDKMRGARRYFIVISFVIAAIVTPPDVLSQLMLAIPLCLLFEAGLFVARFLKTEARQISEKPEEES